MSAYLSGLNRCVSDEESRLVEKKRAESQAMRERLTPLEDRLSRLLGTITIEIQREGLSLASLQSSLRGRCRGSCHPGELGMALRRLGFERRRCWKKGAGFSALWHRTV
jgi:hypothetical protein